LSGPTDVVVTVDLEFSSGGYLDDPAGNRPIGSPSVDLPVDGEPNGLPLMLDILARSGVKATFFVETAQALFFGPDEMGRHVATLLEQGHDLQLHLHPQWLFCERVKAGERLEPGGMTDSMASLDVDRAAELIEHGIGLFREWGAPRPVALRTGNLQVSPAVYRLMSDAGLVLASNVGLGVEIPEDPALRHYNGRHRIFDVVEVPVFSYPAFGHGRFERTRSLTITGVSAAESRSILRSARRSGVGEVVLLTHAHEMVKRDSAHYRDVRRNAVNRRRLERLCAWVADQPDAFRFTTFGERAERWRAGPEAPSVAVSVPAGLSLYSMAENAINDRIAAP